MKKRSGILALVLALSLILGSFTAVFAATGPATDATKKAIEESGIQCIQKIKNEVDAEKIAKMLSDEVIDGKYKLIDTATLAKAVSENKKMVIIDTMPEGWYNAHHIPGAICSIVGAMDGDNRFPIKADEKAPLLNKVKKAVGTKNVKYYWNAKTKKWSTKKPSAKNWKKCSKKKDANYGKKTKTVKKVNKDAMIVVYCGFVGCARSHEGAKFLVENGYTNVYRYSGGISAWVDDNQPIEGTDVN